MTTNHGFIDRASRAAERLPLPRIVAWLLGVSSAFFCLTMPPRLVDRLMEGVGLPGGFMGHGLLTAVFTVIVTWTGWRALSVITERERERALVPLPAEPITPRRRPIGAAGAGAPMALRRGDAHPDAPPRRPIFAAHDLGASFDELGQDKPAAEEEPPLELADVVEAAPVAEAPAQAAAEAEVATPEPAAEDAIAEVVGDEEPPLAPEPAETEPELAEAEPLELVEPLAPAEPVAVEEPVAEAAVPSAPVAQDEEAEEAEDAEEVEPLELDRPATLAALMARFEGGLGRLGDDLPPPPDMASVTHLNPPERDSQEALRDALAALQRMAARQR